MSFVKIWVHAVWSTKNRRPILTDDVRTVIFEHIKENAKEKDIDLRAINGYKDHIHCLIRLKNDQTIAKVIQLIKGESSYWANQNVTLQEKLSWQKQYFAVSVSESLVPKVAAYINEQEKHHKKMTWEEEYSKFISIYNFNIKN